MARWTGGPMASDLCRLPWTITHVSSNTTASRPEIWSRAHDLRWSSYILYWTTCSLKKQQAAQPTPEQLQHVYQRHLYVG